MTRKKTYRVMSQSDAALAASESKQRFVQVEAHVRANTHEFLAPLHVPHKVRGVLHLRSDPPLEPVDVHSAYVEGHTFEPRWLRSAMIPPGHVALIEDGPVLVAPSSFRVELLRRFPGSSLRLLLEPMSIPAVADISALERRRDQHQLRQVIREELEIALGARSDSIHHVGAHPPPMPLADLRDRVLRELLPHLLHIPQGTIPTPRLLKDAATELFMRGDLASSMSQSVRHHLAALSRSGELSG